jgi:ABC-type glycerol-3-phosphate transport system substrate-binding protein
MGLLAKDFNTRDRITVRNDFIDGKTAMVISPYEDKVAFLTGAPTSFTPGVSELPVLYNGQSRNYYYVEDINILVASKNAQNSEAVKKVYNWFINDALSSDNKFNILKYGTGRVAELDKYDKNDNFKYEKKDPTGSFDYNYTKIQELFCKVIDGTRNVDDVIKELNNYSIECMDKVIKVDANYFKNYIDKE